MVLAGANVIGFQVVLAVCKMVTNLILSIVLMIGISGPAWGSAISVVVCVLVPTSFYLRRMLRQLESPAVHPPSD